MTYNVASDPLFVILRKLGRVSDDDIESVQKRIDAAFSWQPIETAPSRVERYCSYGMCLDKNKLTWFHAGRPIYWMPLPNPPGDKT